jgi:hypothetical protein
MTAKVLTQHAVGTETLSRVLREGYGPGAWHGPDMAAALADVPAELAYRRPAKGRHNIAEIALHHAWVVRNVLTQLTHRTPPDFPLSGDDWFVLESAHDLAWSEITALLASYQQELAAAAQAGELQSSDTDALEIVLGVTCHANYHAGQIQLVKRLLEAPATQP